MSHLRAGIAIDHSGSFLVIGTLVVTQPLYRAQVQVWAVGMNLTFWNWSGQRDVRVFASQIRTGCGRLSATLPARYKRFAFIYARTLSGSSPGTLLKKARHRDGAVLVLLTGAGNGTRTRECQLGKLMPYHLAMPAYVLASITRLSCSIQGW